MRKNIRRAVTLVLALVMLIAASACTINVQVTLDEEAIEALQNSANSVNTGTTPTQPTTQPTTQSTTQPTTQPSTQGTDSTTNGSTDTTAPSTAAPTDAPSNSSMPSTPADILNKYSEVVNQAKKTDKPGYTKVEYQTLPEEHRNLGGLADKVIGIAEGFMTDEATARANAAPNAPGTDLGGFPPYHNPSACLLTDASAIKAADCKDNGDGTYTITITLNDENNPQPPEDGAATAPSAHGGMFAPMSKADIDETLAGIPLLKVNGFDLVYTDCTATLVYNPSNNHIVSLTHIMNVDIQADIKLGISIKGSARLVNYMYITDLVYA